ncbi:hypothetical protein GCM10023334_046520 [Nonomuraea thailandensis]
MDKAQIAVPVHAYLIDHPRHGVMKVDTGVNWEQAHDHDGYYDLTSRLLTERDEYRLDPGQDLRVRLARLGYDAAQVGTVFLTHVHDDHAGGLRSLPGPRWCWTAGTGTTACSTRTPSAWSRTTSPSRPSTPAPSARSPTARTTSATAASSCCPPPATRPVTCACCCAWTAAACCSSATPSTRCPTWPSTRSAG